MILGFTFLTERVTLGAGKGAESMCFISGLGYGCELNLELVSTARQTMLESGSGSTFSPDGIKCRQFLRLTDPSVLFTLYDLSHSS